MNNLKENIVPVILPYMFLPLQQATFLKRYWLFSCWSSSSYLWASRFCIPRGDPYCKPNHQPTVVSSSNSELLNNTHSNVIIEQPGAYTFHLVEEHQSSPTSVGGHWQVCNAHTWALSTGTQVVAAVTREQPCGRTALSLQLPALPGIRPLMGLWLS